MERLNVGNLFFELKLDSRSYNTALENAKKQAIATGKDINKYLSKINISNSKILISVDTDENKLVGLNKHLDKKVAHLKNTQRYFKSNPLKVVVNDTALIKLNNRLSDVSKSTTINVAVEAQSVYLQINSLKSFFQSQQFKIKPIVDKKHVAEQVKDLVNSEAIGKITVEMKAGSFSQGSNKELVNVVKDVKKATQQAKPQLGLLSGIQLGLGQSLAAGLTKAMKSSFGFSLSGVGKGVVSAIAKPANVLLKENIELQEYLAQVKADAGKKTRSFLRDIGEAYAIAVDAELPGGTEAGLFSKARANIFTRAVAAKLKLIDEAAIQAETAGDIKQSVVAKVRQKVSHIKTNPDEALNTVGIKNGLGTLASKVFNPAVLNQIFEPIADSFVKNYRVPTLEEISIPRVQQRSQDILKGKRLSGQKTETLNDINSEVEKLFLITGGFAGAKGQSAAMIAKEIRGMEIPRSKTNAVRGYDSDINPQLDKIASLANLSKVNAKGFNLDAIEMASQALVAIQKNPEIKIKLVGESSGGYTAAEAKKILDLMGKGDQVEYLGVGTAELIGGLDKNSGRKLLSTDEYMGRHAKGLYRGIGLAPTNSLPQQNILGVREHESKHYASAGVPEYHNLLYGESTEIPGHRVARFKEDNEYYKKGLETNQFRRLDYSSYSNYLNRNVNEIKRYIAIADENIKKELEIILEETERLRQELYPEDNDFLELKRQATNNIKLIKTIKSSGSTDLTKILPATKDLEFIKKELQKKSLASAGTPQVKIKTLLADIDETLLQQKEPALFKLPELKPKSSQLEIASVGKEATENIVKIDEAIDEALADLKQKVATFQESYQTVLAATSGKNQNKEFGVIQSKTTLANSERLKQEIKAKRLALNIPSIGTKEASQFAQLIGQVGQVEKNIKRQLASIKLAASDNQASQQVGKNIVGGISRGIEKTSTDAVDAIANTDKQIIEQTKKDFEMQSPSKLYEKFGKFIVVGLQLGLNTAKELKVKVPQLLNSPQASSSLDQLQKLIAKSKELASQASVTGSKVAGFASSKIAQLTGLDKLDVTQAQTLVNRVQRYAKVLEKSAQTQPDHAQETSGQKFLNRIIPRDIRQQVNQGSNKAPELFEAAQKKAQELIDSAPVQKGLTYYFKLNIKGLADVVDQFFKDVSSAFKKLEETAGKSKYFGDVLKPLTGGMKNLSLTTIAAGASFLRFFGMLGKLAAVTQLQQAVIATATAFESLNRQFIATAKNEIVGQQSLEKVMATAKELRLSRQDAIAGASAIQAGLRTTVTNQGSIDIIQRAASQVSKVYGTTLQDQQAIVSQIASLGQQPTIQSQDIQSLSSLIPDAYSIGARAIGGTEQEFSRLLSSNGGISTSDFLPAFARQLEAETAPKVNKAFDTITNANQRLSNSQEELQLAFADFAIPVEKLRLNVFAAALEEATKAASVFQNYLQGLAFYGVTKFAQSLINLGGQALIVAKSIPFLSTALGAFAKIALQVAQNIIPIISKLLVEFAIFQVALDIIMMTVARLKNASGEIGEFANQSENNLSKYTQALQEAQAGTEKFAIALPKTFAEIKGKSYLEDTLIGGLIPKDWARTVENFLTETNKLSVIHNILPKSFKQSRTEKELEDKGLASNKLINTSRQRVISVKAQLEPGQVLRQLESFDKQLDDISGSRRAVAIIDPGNSKKLLNLKAQEEQILKQREKYAKPAEILAKGLEIDIKGFQVALAEYDRLAENQQITEQEYISKTSALKNALEESQDAQRQLNEVIKSSLTPLLAFHRAWEKIGNNIADTQGILDKNANVSKTLILNQETKGKLTPGDTSFLNAQSNIFQTSAQLQASKQAIAQYYAELNNQDAGKTFSKLGVSDHTSAATLRLMAENASPQFTKEKALLEKYASVKDLEKEAFGQQTQVAEAKNTLYQQMMGLTKQVADYYFNTARQVQQNQLEIQKISLQASQLSMKNKLKSALLDAGENIFTTIGDSLIESLTQLQEIETLQLENKSAKQQEAFAIEDNNRSFLELSRSLPTDFPSIPVELDLSNITADANVQALNEAFGLTKAQIADVNLGASLLNTTISQSSQKLAESSGAVEKLNAALNTSNQKTQEAFQSTGIWNQAIASIQNSFNSVGSSIKAVLDKIDFSEKVDRLGDNFNAVISSTSNAFSELTSGIQRIFNEIDLTATIQSLYEGLKQNTVESEVWHDVTQKINDTLAESSGWLQKLGSDTRDVLVAETSKWASGLSQVPGIIYDALNNTLRVEETTKNLHIAFQQVSVVVGNIINQTAQLLSNTLQPIKQTINQYVVDTTNWFLTLTPIQQLTANIHAGLTATSQVFTGLINQTIAWLTNLQQAPGIISGIAGAAGQSARGFIKDTLQNASDGINYLFNNGKNTKPYKILESVGGRIETVKQYSDLAKHHPSAGIESGRNYDRQDGHLEEIRRQGNNRHVKKDFILQQNGRQDVSVPSPVPGYIRRKNDKWNTVQVVDSATNQIVASFLHMGKILVENNQQVVAGQALGIQGDKGSPRAIHVHAEMEKPLFEAYIKALVTGNFTKMSGGQAQNKEPFDARLSPEAAKAVAAIEKSRELKADRSANMVDTRSQASQVLTQQKSQYYFGKAANYSPSDLSKLTPTGKKALEALKNPNVRAFLDAIAAAELGTADAKKGGYGYLFGDVNGKETFNPNALMSHPRQVRKKWGHSSSATGRYQTMNFVWDDDTKYGSKGLGLQDFKPQSQEILAVGRMMYRGVLDKIMRGDIQGALPKAAGEWASIQGNPYGQGTPDGKISKFLQNFQEAKQQALSSKTQQPIIQQNGKAINQPQLQQAQTPTVPYTLPFNPVLPQNLAQNAYQNNQYLPPGMLRSQSQTANQAQNTSQQQLSAASEQNRQQAIIDKQLEVTKRTNATNQKLRKEGLEFQKTTLQSARGLTDLKYSAIPNKTYKQTQIMDETRIVRDYNDNILERQERLRQINIAIKNGNDLLAQTTAQLKDPNLSADVKSALSQTKKQIETNLPIYEKAKTQYTKEIVELQKGKEDAIKGIREIAEFENRQRERKNTFESTSNEISKLQEQIAGLKTLQQNNPLAPELLRLPALEKNMALMQVDLELDKQTDEQETLLFKNEISKDTFKTRVEEYKKINLEKQKNIELTYQQAKAEASLNRATLELDKRSQNAEFNNSIISEQIKAIQLSQQRNPLDKSLGDIAQLTRDSAMSSADIENQKKRLEIQYNKQLTPEERTGALLNQAILDSARAGNIQNQYRFDIDQQKVTEAQSIASRNQSQIEFDTKSSIDLINAQAQRNIDRGGNQFVSNALSRKAATMSENIRYRGELDNLNSTVASMRLQGLDVSDEKLASIRQNLQNIHDINLENLNEQFKTFSATIENLGKQAFQGLSSDLANLILQGGKLSDVFNNFANTILSGVLNSGLNAIIGGLTQGMFGGGKQSSGGSDGLIGFLGDIFGGGSGGGIGSLLGGLFYDGGMVKNYADGGIVEAIARERSMTGARPHLAVLSEGERVLTIEQARRFNSLNLEKVLNYADGGMVGGANIPATNSTINNSSSPVINMVVNVDNKGSSSQSGDDGGKLGNSLRNAVVSVLIAEQRPGGALYGR